MKVRDMHKFMKKHGVKNIHKMSPEKQVRTFLKLMHPEKVDARIRKGDEKVPRGSTIKGNINGDSVYYRRLVGASTMVSSLLPNDLENPKEMLKVLADAYSERGECIFEKYTPVQDAFRKTINGATQNGNRRTVSKVLKHPNEHVQKIAKDGILRSAEFLEQNPGYVTKTFKDNNYYNHRILLSTLRNNRKLVEQHFFDIVDDMNNKYFQIRKAAIDTLNAHPGLTRKNIKKIREKTANWEWKGDNGTLQLLPKNPRKDDKGELEVPANEAKFIKHGKEKIDIKELKGKPIRLKQSSQLINGVLRTGKQDEKLAILRIIGDDPHTVDRHITGVIGNLNHTDPFIEQAALNAIGKYPQLVKKHSRKLASFLPKRNTQLREAAIELLGANPVGLKKALELSPESIRKMKVRDLATLFEELENAQKKRGKSRSAKQAADMLRKEIFRVE